MTAQNGLMDSLPSYDTVNQAAAKQAKIAARQQRVANTKYVFPPDYHVVLYANRSTIECCFSRNISDLLKFAPPGLSCVEILNSNKHRMFVLDLTKRFSFLKWLKFKRLVTMKVEHLQPLSPGSCSVTITGSTSVFNLHVSPSDYSKIVRVISGLDGGIRCSMVMV